MVGTQRMRMALYAPAVCWLLLLALGTVSAAGRTRGGRQGSRQRSSVTSDQTVPRILPPDAGFITNDLGHCNDTSLRACGQDTDCNSGVTCQVPSYAARIPHAGDDPILVAHIDSGIDCDHPDLAGRCWRNMPECSGVPGVDDDNNGYVDDCEGWDFIDNDNDPREVSEDCNSGSINGHGLATASVYGAVSGNGAYIAGLAADADIRILNLRAVGCGNAGSIVGLTDAIRYASAMGADIVNGSLLISKAWDDGQPDSCHEEQPAVGPCATLCNAIEDLDGLYIGSSGQFQPRNLDLLPAYPPACRRPNQLTIGGIDAGGNYFTHWGAGTVQMAVKAENVKALAHFSGNCTYCDSDGFLLDATGSSFAAPQVTALAASLLSRDRTLPATALRDVLLAHAAEGAIADGSLVEEGRIFVGFDEAVASLTVPTMGLTTVPLSDPTVRTFLDGFSAVDNLDGSVAVSHDGPAMLLPGTNVIGFTAVDNAGNTGSARAIIIVVPQVFSDGSPVPEWAP